MRYPRLAPAAHYPQFMAANKFPGQLAL